MTSLLKLEITVIFWLSLPVHSGSLKRIDYPKQICLDHSLSFECFHCSELIFIFLFAIKCTFSIKMVVQDSFRSRIKITEP